VQGTWLAESAEFAGQKWPEAMAKGLLLTIDKDKYLVKDGESPDKGTIKFESSGKFKSMVIKGNDGPNNGKTFLAIYELNGDTLTICYDLAGKELPSEFKTKENTKLFLVTYKRKNGLERHIAMPEFLTNAIGEWSGKTKLLMPGERDRTSDSKLTIAKTAMGKFLTLSYTWSYDGNDQQGMLLLGAGKNGSVASWVDSWHNGNAIMAMRGESAGNVTLLGSYPAPPGPDWKWRFVISEDGGKLKFVMTNISPKGEEYPAVEAEYQRK
jgi:uncharacterized protein (TIGR03067 family)